MYLPKDFATYEPYGTCGLAVIAAIEHREVRDVKKDWESIIGAYDGFANMRDIEKLLMAHNINFKRKKGLKAKTFPEIKTKYAIIRVQWLKEDGKEYYWREAPIYTHYVLIERDESGRQILFCNSMGQVRETETEYKTYFDRDMELEGKVGGYITSYLEIDDLVKQALSELI